jgi:hypothetical protein
LPVAPASTGGGTVATPRPKPPTITRDTTPKLTFAVAPSRLTIETNGSGKSVTRTIRCWSSGTGKLSYSAQPTADWIEVKKGKTKGSAQSFEIKLEPKKLKPGTYLAAIEISLEGAAPGSIRIPVELSTYQQQQ